ncbi:protein cornichon-like protein 4-like [Senna tora]|uniref:Protein cornichon-like protein 4-like n=1 Tax=Senna tora TaxID=362788 RepID=A0A835CMQ9_9FABA|nr:protein cornichon-like protein 4-like [Senna tora]
MLNSHGDGPQSFGDTIESLGKGKHLVLQEFADLCMDEFHAGFWERSSDLNRYISRQHLVDVTEIYNQLKWEKKKRFFKVGYLILLFLVSVFWLVWSITEDADYD